MTRINCVPPSELTDKHLIAEYRELPRIFGLARPLLPTEHVPQYTLGKGHVKFFYDKLRFLEKRFSTIVEEMKQRGFTVNYPKPPASLLGTYGTWNPTEEALQLNRARIQERLNK